MTKWEIVEFSSNYHNNGCQTERLKVPGGYLYKVSRNVNGGVFFTTTFVPKEGHEKERQ